MGKKKKPSSAIQIVKSIVHRSGNKHQPALVPDPSGAQLAIFGDDAGTAERHQKGVAFDEGKPDQKIGEMIEDVAAPDGKRAIVHRESDVLDLMLRNGTIGEDEVRAGRAFRDAYFLVHASPVGTVKLDSVGGGVGQEGLIDMRIEAAQRLDGFYDMLGGADKLGSVALREIVGRGATLTQLVKMRGHSAHFWRGGMIGALQVLAKHLAPKDKSPRVKHVNSPMAIGR